MRSLNFVTSVWGWFLLFSFVQTISSAAVESCSAPLVRKEWRKLTSTEKSKYISAVKCLQRKPAKTTGSTPGALNRFDDFQGVHIRNTDSIHFVGHFQAWHRFFVATYEKALREECGYAGAQPYWDWTLDSKDLNSFLASPVLSSDSFGGNGPYIANSSNPGLVVPGRTGGGCVQDGAFKDLELHLGPATNIERNNQCLTRDFSPLVVLSYLTTAMTTKALRQTDFGWFDKIVQGGIVFSEFTYHAGGHLGLGGELGTIADVYASPGDPLFYLHHTNMDRLWWKWQSMDLPRRLKDISGPIKQFEFPFGNSTSGGNVTLSYEIGLNELAPNIPLSKVMNIQGGTLCYRYE